MDDNIKMYHKNIMAWFRLNSPDLQHRTITGIEPLRSIKLGEFVD
jgi:hypothetical protein